MSKRARRQLAEDLPVWPEAVMGGKFVRLLETQLEQLRDESAHGNRELHLDDVFVVHLLAFFNPTIRSLRTIEDFSQTRQVQKHISLPKVCKSTLSDFHRLADPERLQLVINALRRQLSRKELSQQGDVNELSTLLKHTIAIDGTFLPAMADVAWAICNKNNHGAQRHRARLDVHLDVGSWLPEAIVVPDPGQSESASAITHIQAGKLYLYDRGYNSFALINAHYDKSETNKSETIFTARSHFVIRYRKPGGNSPQLQAACEQELSEDDRAAGVISDRVGQFGSSKPSRHAINAVQLREVLVTYKDAKGQTQTLRLITNLLDVSAATIAKLYRYRWQVEEFHKALKTGCSLEDRQYQTSQRLEAVTGMLSVVVVRLLQLKSVARAEPERAATEVVPELWIKTLRILRPKAARRENWTVRDFYRQLAGLGGFLGRKSDGEPGWITIWRGFDKLALALRYEEQRSRCG